MKGFIANIEEVTLENEAYRKVLYTGKHSQLVLMCIQPGDEIGEETHKLDQFIRIEEGTGVAILDGVEHEIADGTALLIPQGMTHNVINAGDVPLKLYSLYAPLEHMDGIEQETKDDEAEEHWDGTTTE